MSSRQVRNLVVIILILLNFLALWGIFRVWWGQEGPAGVAESPKAADIPVAPMLRNQQGPDAFRVVTSKNLFSPDRTGPDLGPAAKQGVGNLEGKLLLGTFIIGNQRLALIGGATSKKPQNVTVETVRQGEEWEGFKVIEIRKDAVVFQGGDGNTTLQFPE